VLDADLIVHVRDIGHDQTVSQTADVMTILTTRLAWVKTRLWSKSGTNWICGDDARGTPKRRHVG
jgi:hypothetical protein